MVTEALGPKDSISSGQLQLIFGGYNTIGEEFGATSTFVSCWPSFTCQRAPSSELLHSSVVQEKASMQTKSSRLGRSCGLPLTGPDTSGGRSLLRAHRPRPASITAVTATTVSFFITLYACSMLHVWGAH